MPHVVTSTAYPPVTVRAGETLLDAFLRHGIDLPFSCRGGVCQTCLHRSTSAPPPARSQHGLPAALAERGYFMPCVCTPEAHMSIEPPRPQDFVVDCIVDSVHEECGAVRVLLEPMRSMRVQHGDWIRIACDDEFDLRGRVASLPEETFYLGLVIDDAAAATRCTLESIGRTVRVRPESSEETRAAAERAPKYIEPDPQLWHELGEGRVVREVLDDFYERVFADAQLQPYFRGVTREHVAGKQYSFLHKSMTGADVYFGDSPRHAHHWMVISDALFEHRQALMAQVQRDHGLTDDQMRRWARFELPFRTDIVKSRALPLTRFGTQLPLDGQERTMLDVGSVCDACGSAVDAGTMVMMHRRLGTISCPSCTGPV